MKTNKKPTVLITGCSSGIGRALVKSFSDRGCRVIATARKPAAIADLKSAAVETLQLDVTDAKSIKKCLAACGEVDILVNNAGKLVTGPLAELPVAELESQYATNLFGPAALVAALFPQMADRRSGMIMNISSVSGVLTTPFAGAYCSSKAAVNAWSDALRLELAPFGIKVMTVQPGGIRTSLSDNSLAGIEQFKGPRSRYSSVFEFIRQRAMTSQDNAAPAGTFADALVERALSDNPPALFRYGPESVRLPLFKALLPIRVLDRILAKKFGLDKPIQGR